MSLFLHSNENCDKYTNMFSTLLFTIKIKVQSTRTCTANLQKKIAQGLLQIGHSGLNYLVIKRSIFQLMHVEKMTCNAAKTVLKIIQVELALELTGCQHIVRRTFCDLELRSKECVALRSAGSCLLKRIFSAPCCDFFVKTGS